MTEEGSTAQHPTALGRVSGQLRGSHTLYTLLGVAVAIGIGIFRHGPRFAFDTIWGEDGQIFYGRSMLMPVSDVFAQTYAGYLHTVPRLLSLIADALPMSFAAIVLTGGSAIVVGLLAVLVFHASGDVFQSGWARWVVSGSMLLLPLISIENLNNTANLQWTLMFASFWMLIWRPEKLWQRLIALVVVALTVLSDPLTIVLFPLLVLRFVIVRDRQSWALAATMIVAGGFQALAITSGPHERDTFVGALGAKAILDGYTYDVIRAIIPNVTLLRDGSFTRAIAVGAIVIAIALGLIRNWRRALPLAGTALFFSVVMYLAPVMGGSEVAPRYLLTPALLLVAAVVAICDAQIIGASRLRLVAPALLTIVLAIAWTSDFRASSFRTSGPTWSNQLSWAQEHCSTAPKEEVVRIQTMPAPWSVYTPCDQVNKRR